MTSIMDELVYEGAGSYLNLDQLADVAHKISRAKGFYEVEPRNESEMIALMHSELSEALEAIRHGNPPDVHCPEFSSLEVKIADTMIRIFDFCAYKKLRLLDALLAKMRYNESRPFKHGKKF